MTAGGTKKNPVPDAHAFVKFVTGKDLEKYLSTLKAIATKKKPLSIYRLNIIMMSVFKYLETNIKKESKQVQESLDSWL